MRNKTTFKSSLLVLVFAASATPSFAFSVDIMANINQSSYVKAFKALDEDSSNTLSKAEAAKEKLFAKNFSAADKNNDGSLDQDEYTEYRTQAEEANVKRIANDSFITSKVKGSLLKEQGTKSLDVSVTTYKGTVLLSGFVETERQMQQAEKIAAGVDGVRMVKNGLVVKVD
jgi:hyperosmotically inducible protein